MKKATAALAAALAAAAAFADSTPVMVSLLTPIQVPYRSYDVTGFRLSLIYGDCVNFTGFDLGLVPRTAEDFTGLAIGGVNVVGDEFSGLSIGGVNYAGGRHVGCQVGLVNWNTFASAEPGHRSIGAQFGVLNAAESFCGLQDGIVNFTTDTFVGWQTSPLNLADNMTGVQSGFWLIGAVNIAGGSVEGAQIGLVNFANRMESGIQIGIVNVIAHGGWLPFLPLINGGF